MDQWLVVLRAAERLTPQQWRILAQAGCPRWCDVATVWEPLSQAECWAALGLCRLGLLDQEGQAAYRVTPLGERVAGLRLVMALRSEWEDAS